MGYPPQGPYGQQPYGQPPPQQGGYAPQPYGQQPPQAPQPYNPYQQPQGGYAPQQNYAPQDSSTGYDFGSLYGQADHSRQLLDKGTYDAIVESAEWGRTKDGTKGAWTIVFRTTTGDKPGTKLTMTLSVSQHKNDGSENSQGLGIMFRQLAAMGVPVPPPAGNAQPGQEFWNAWGPSPENGVAQAITGRPVTLTVIQDEYDGITSNKVRDIRPPRPGAPAQLPQPGQAQQAPYGQAPQPGPPGPAPQPYSQAPQPPAGQGYGPPQQQGPPQGYNPAVPPYAQPAQPGQPGTGQFTQQGQAVQPGTYPQQGYGPPQQNYQQGPPANGYPQQPQQQGPPPQQGDQPAPPPWAQ